MEAFRLKTLLLLIFLATRLFAIEANHGIAFVHGTKDHRNDAYGIYWKIPFILKIAQALPDPSNVYVVRCDYNQYMWHKDAGDCTAQQLINFIKEKKLSTLTVYTHSHGGNVIRWILSNPTYNYNYMILKGRIKEVIAMAPSSGGTPLADLALTGITFESSVSWLLGFTANAIKQQRLDEMYILNEELLMGTPSHPYLPVPFKTIIGTDVEASPLNNASYCNGFVLNSGLKFTQLYLNSCSDGFLDCSSQTAAGDVWFYDKEKLKSQMTLNHNQSRHSCFGLDKLLISVFAPQGV